MKTDPLEQILHDHVRQPFWKGIAWALTLVVFFWLLAWGMFA